MFSKNNLFFHLTFDLKNPSCLLVNFVKKKFQSNLKKQKSFVLQTVG